MKSGGIGVGSASIILVFTVLCLTVFSLITLIVAGNTKALVDAEESLVMGYYKADALAEYIVAEIAEADAIPDSVRGIEIISAPDFETGVSTASFVCPISDKKELFVCFTVSDNSCEILCWRMTDIGQWEIDDRIYVWQGSDEIETEAEIEDEIDIGDPMDAWLGLDKWMD